MINLSDRQKGALYGIVFFSMILSILIELNEVKWYDWVLIICSTSLFYNLLE